MRCYWKSSRGTDLQQGKGRGQCLECWVVLGALGEGARELHPRSATSTCTLLFQLYMNLKTRIQNYVEKVLSFPAEKDLFGTTFVLYGIVPQQNFMLTPTGLRSFTSHFKTLSDFVQGPDWLLPICLTLHKSVKKWMKRPIVVCCGRGGKLLTGQHAKIHVGLTIMENEGD